MVNHTIGGYEILRVLHEGSTCTLYVARDAALERHVVIKVLNGSQTLDDEVRVRFLREARSAAVLEHPNICSIFALHDTPEGLHYFVMPLYRGQTLRDTLSCHSLTLEQALSVAQQVAYALGHAHSHGVIHRDLKPENVFITAEALVKLLDFGVAKLGHDNITRDGSLMGTVAYMAPEQIEGAPASVQTDIWAWGTMFFEMLCGYVPYAHAQGFDMMAAIRDDPVPALPDRVLGDVAVERFVPLLQACLAKDPSKRARSMRDVVQLLEPLIADIPHFVTVPTRLTVSTVPVWHKPFVGREAERSQLASYIAEGARLLTLSGQAGVGKTHMALAFLYDPAIHALFPEGMLYVPVAAAKDDKAFLLPAQDSETFERVAQQLADTLEHDLGCVIDRPPWETSQVAPTTPTKIPNATAALTERVRKWRQALTDALGAKRVLLFIDGVHKPLTGLASLLEQLTQFCPHVVILTTARQRLGVPSERVIVTQGLPLPERPQDLATNPAAQLFMHTSQRTLQPAEEAVLLRLCQYLGGWPAALELAAQWHAQRDTYALVDAAETFALGSRQGLPALSELLDTMWASLNWQEASALARLSSLGEHISFATASYVAEVSAELLMALLDKHMLERDLTHQQTSSYQQAHPRNSYHVNRFIVRYAQHKLASAPSLQTTLQQRLADYLARRLTGVAPEHLTLTTSLLPVTRSAMSSSASPSASTSLSSMSLSEMALSESLSESEPSVSPAASSATSYGASYGAPLAYVPLNQVEWHNLPTAWQVWLERPPKRFATMMMLLSLRASYVYEEATVADLLEQAQQRFSHYQQQLRDRPNLSLRQQQQWQQLLQLRYVAALQATCQYVRLGEVSAARRCFEVLTEDDLQGLLLDISATDLVLEPLTAAALRSVDMPVDMPPQGVEDTTTNKTNNERTSEIPNALAVDALAVDAFAVDAFERESPFDTEMVAQYKQRAEWQRALEHNLIEAMLLLAEGQRAAAGHRYETLNRRYGDAAWVLMTAPTLARLAVLAAYFAPAHTLRWCERAAAAYRQRGDGWGEQLMAVTQAFVSWTQGDLPPAADRLQGLLEHAHLAPVTRVQGTLLLAEVRFEQGQWHDAKQRFDQAHSLLASVSPSARGHLYATALAGLAKVASAQGDKVVAYAYLQQALDHAEHSPLRVLEAAASVYLHSKDIDEAALIVVHLASYPEHRLLRDTGLDLPLPDVRLAQNIAALLEQIRFLASADMWLRLEGQASTFTLEGLLEHIRDQLATSEYSF